MTGWVERARERQTNRQSMVTSIITSRLKKYLIGTCNTIKCKDSREDVKVQQNKEVRTKFYRVPESYTSFCMSNIPIGFKIKNGLDTERYGKMACLGLGPQT